MAVGNLQPEYDTIIVGGGSAGAVVAARLTERADRSVLLIEAGPDPEAERQASEAWPRDLRDGRFNSMRAHDWGYSHTPTEGQFDMPLPRGRVMGGSSSVNTCIALRGTPDDYDEWAALGCTGWSWREVLPYFRRLERDLDVGQPGIAADVHGADGPLPIQRPAFDQLSPWQRAFHEACALAGYPPCPDSNAPRSVGFGMHAFNRVGGERWNVARAYLTPEVRQRQALRILPGSFVRRVLFDGKRCVGVEAEKGSDSVTLRARRVVLSAGVFGTPGVLLRSGVGSDAAVRRVGATPIADVPGVAARLLDHPGAALFYAPKRPGVADLGAPIIQNVVRISSGTDGLRDDIQIQSGACVHLPLVRLPLVSLMAHVGKPMGSGTVTFDGFDPHAPPRIESRLLEHPDDRARLVAALQMAERLSQQPPLQRRARLIWPLRGSVIDAGRFSSAITRVSGSAYHPCGTVPMGSEDNPTAVTDPRGRVRGVTGLYVADASIMPTIPTANINLTTIMIGERFGEWLRAGD
jgi:choline dehydrogenase